MKFIKFIFDDSRIEKVKRTWSFQHKNITIMKTKCLFEIFFKIFLRVYK